MAGKRIAVMGTGASGASIGADLTRAGLDVTFIEQWPAHVEAMRAKGVRIEMPEQVLTTPVRAFHLCEAASLRETFDVVLIVVKAYDTRWACELVKPLTVRPQNIWDACAARSMSMLGNPEARCEMARPISA